MTNSRATGNTVLLILALLSTGWPAPGIQLQEGQGLATVTTPAYVAVVTTTGPAILRSLTDRRAGREIPLTAGGLTITAERDRLEWSDAWAPAATIYAAEKAEGNTRLEQRGDALACVSQWSCPVAIVEQTILFSDAAPVIEVSCRAQVTGAVEELRWVLQTPDPRFFQDARVYPGAERVLSHGDNMARFRPAPALAFCHDSATGLGLAASPSDGVRTLSSAIIPGANAVQLAGYSEVLRWQTVPFETQMNLRLLVGMTPDQAMSWHRQHTPGLPALQISDLSAGKLIYRSGETGRGVVEVTNNSPEPWEGRLALAIEGGLGKTRRLPARPVSLEGGETARVPVEWENLGEYGFALTAALRDGAGKQFDGAREFFAVCDNFSRVGQMVVWNPGWMNQEWMIPAWMEYARRDYIGTIEYYCWAPDQVFDLTPDTEEFEPHTESQGAYRARLTRSFLQSLVRQAHGAGLRVLAMDTGWASLGGALDHPEQIKYTREGQPYFFNGAIHDGRRYNAVAVNVYTEQRMREWAREMNASVDMFGWDGVRFDWNFLPISRSDPRYLGTDQAGKVDAFEWFDSTGRSCYDLFPSSDATGAAMVRVWRETVAQAHPNFVYHENFQVSDAAQAQLPRYVQAACSGAGVLREGLLDVAHHYPTWQQWVAALMEVTRIVRPLDGQPSVGWMTGYAPGSVSHRTLQNCMIGSGFHWFGAAEARGSIDDTYRRFGHALRFSEFFYDPGFLPVREPDTVAQVSGDGVERVLWQPFVFVRQRQDRREALVHLVNLPQSDYIIQRHAEPPARTMTVAIALPEGERVTRCRLITPEPEPRVVELSPETNAEGRVVCTVAELRSMASVLVESTSR